MTTAVTQEMLEAVARARPAADRGGRRGRGFGPESREGFDLSGWLAEHDVPVLREGEWDRGGYRYVLEECPWNGHTDASAYIVRFATGAIAAGCHHDSCQGYTWRDLRQHYELGCYERSNRDGADEGSPVGIGTGGNSSQTESLMGYAEESAELFHDAGGTAYATVDVDDHRETYPIRSSRFRSWLTARHYREHGKAPNPNAVSTALETISAAAVFDGPEAPVYIRVAEHGGEVYVDLGNETWEAVRITREGWTVVPDPPVRFVRKAGSAPLPRPEAGGDAAGLRPFLNVDGEGDFRLTVAWAAFSLTPWGPYPILVLQGEQGSAKSTSVRVLRALVDPAVEPLRSLPKNERDLAIAAGNSWVLAFDNLSGIPDRLSDALCRLATGGGFATRQLYTDDEEVIFSAKRPIILNGIDDIATRGDLQERSLLASLPAILEERRVEEAAFWADFEAVKPSIFGALLDGVSVALRDAGSVRLERKPRMADFAVRATAMEACFGWEPGSFVEAYEANLQEASEVLLGNEPLVDAIEALLKDHGINGAENEWSGTATELLRDLTVYADEAIKRTKAWPGGPQVLSKKMRRLAPSLRSMGIEYSEGEEGHRKKKVKTLRQPTRESTSEHEGDWEPGNDVREDEPDDGANEGEERPADSPFDFNFEFDGDKVGNPFASDDSREDVPESQGEERAR